MQDPRRWGDCCLTGSLVRPGSPDSCISRLASAEWDQAKHGDWRARATAACVLERWVSESLGKPVLLALNTWISGKGKVAERFLKEAVPFIYASLSHSTDTYAAALPGDWDRGEPSVTRRWDQGR